MCTVVHAGVQQDKKTDMINTHYTGKNQTKFYHFHQRFTIVFQNDYFNSNRLIVRQFE